MKEGKKIRLSQFKIIMLSLFCVLSSFTLLTFLFGNSGHLYTLAKVELIMKDGSERMGYMPLYTGWGFSRRSEIDAGTDVLDSIINKKTSHFAFVDTYYTFQEIGSMVAQEDIEKVEVDLVKHVIFFSWQNFGGAGALDQLPLSTIRKLKSKTILYVQRVEGDGCSDYYYINQDSSISENEYGLLFKYGPTLKRRGEFSRLLYLTTTDYYEGRYGRPLSMDLLMDSLYDFVEYARHSIQNLSYHCNSPYIENLRLHVKRIYEKRLKFYEALISYLAGVDTHVLTEFIAEEVDNDDERERLIELIQEPIGEDWLLKVKWIVKLSANHLAYGRKEDMLFDEIIKKHDISVFVHSWD